MPTVNRPFSTCFPLIGEKLLSGSDQTVLQKLIELLQCFRKVKFVNYQDIQLTWPDKDLTSVIPTKRSDMP